MGAATQLIRKNQLTATNTNSNQPTATNQQQPTMGEGRPTGIFCHVITSKKGRRSFRLQSCSHIGKRGRRREGNEDEKESDNGTTGDNMDPNSCFGFHIGWPGSFRMSPSAFCPARNCYLDSLSSLDAAWLLCPWLAPRIQYPSSLIK